MGNRRKPLVILLQSGVCIKLHQCSYYDTLSDFNNFLSVNNLQHHALDYFYFPVRIQKTADTIYKVTSGKFVHVSKQYIKKGYRTLGGKWVKAGWKTIHHINWPDHSYFNEAKLYVQECLEKMRQRLAPCVFTYKNNNVPTYYCPFYRRDYIFW